MILGIRPEDVSDPLTGPAVESAVEAPLEVIAPMGAETYLHLFTGATSFVARVRPIQGLAVNKKVRVSLDLEKAHLFDPLTEQALK